MFWPSPWESTAVGLNEHSHTMEVLKQSCMLLSIKRGGRLLKI